MRIMMMTNTYLPHVGGVARSVSSISDALRKNGHQVMVVAPEFEGMRDDGKSVVRVSALQKFNGSDFSVIVPSDGFLQCQVDAFQPDILHSHHPFLLGGAAQRLAAINGIPLVFTHHTLYEQYTHYAPGDSQFMKRFVSALSTEYANLAQLVIAPSESVRDLLEQRGVVTRIVVIPTGVDEIFFRLGNGPAFRKVMGIPTDAFLVGHVGRLAQEKNLGFMSEAIARFMKLHVGAWFLLVGTGPAHAEIEGTFRRHKVEDRVVMAGSLGQPILTSAYRAMDVFAFASQSETQGMVLTEAMATGTPVVAVDASGVREVLRNGENGVLLERQSLSQFVAALRQIHDSSPAQCRRFYRAALETARRFSIDHSVAQLERQYEPLLARTMATSPEAVDSWESVRKKLSAEWGAFANLASAAGKALAGGSDKARS